MKDRSEDDDIMKFESEILGNLLEVETNTLSKAQIHLI